MVSNGTTWTSQSNNPWVTAFDCDFTAEATHNFPADTSYSICGKTWKVEGVGAVAHSTIALTNGSGLVLATTTAGGSDYGGLGGSGTNMKLAPLLWLSLSQLGISGLDWSSRLRVSVYVPSQSMSPTAGATLFWGVDNDTPAENTAGSSWYSINCSRSTGGAGNSPTLGASFQGGAQSSSAGNTSLAPGAAAATASWGAAVSSSRCEFRLGITAGETSRVDSAGAYAGAWPSAWAPWVNYAATIFPGQGSGAYLGWANLDASAPQGPSDALGVMVGLFYLDSFSHGSNATIARLRVEYKL